MPLRIVELVDIVRGATHSEIGIFVNVYLQRFNRSQENPLADVELSHISAVLRAGSFRVLQEQRSFDIFLDNFWSL